ENIIEWTGEKTVEPESNKYIFLLFEQSVEYSKITYYEHAIYHLTDIKFSSKNGKINSTLKINLDMKSYYEAEDRLCKKGSLLIHVMSFGKISEDTKELNYIDYDFNKSKDK